MTESATRTLTIELKFAHSRLKAELPVPAEPVHPMRLLPVFQSLAEAVVNLGVSAAAEKGESVSCK